MLGYLLEVDSARVVAPLPADSALFSDRIMSAPARTIFPAIFCLFALFLMGCSCGDGVDESSTFVRFGVDGVNGDWSIGFLNFPLSDWDLILAPNRALPDHVELEIQGEVSLVIDDNMVSLSGVGPATLALDCAADNNIDCDNFPIWRIDFVELADPGPLSLDILIDYHSLIVDGGLAPCSGVLQERRIERTLSLNTGDTEVVFDSSEGQPSIAIGN